MNEANQISHYIWAFSGEFPSGPLPEKDVKFNLLNPNRSGLWGMSVRYIDIQDAELEGDSELARILSYYFETEEPKPGTATIKMMTRDGFVIGQWALTDAIPESVNFGDLNYTSDPTPYLEITFRYKSLIPNSEN